MYLKPLDQLASEGVLGLLEPAGTGITPDSGPGHLVLIGYAHVEHQAGRGLLSAVGVTPGTEMSYRSDVEGLRSDTRAEIS